VYHWKSPNKIADPDNLKEIYAKYIEAFDEDSPYHVDFKTFMECNAEFYKRAVESVLEGRELRLPFGMGRILIEKNKPTKYKSMGYIDWATTKAIGKQVFHLNEHSDGYNYYIRWRSPRLVHNQRLYKFVPTRSFRRTLAKIIKNREYDYFEI